jgi:hypothetical protein
VQCPWCGVDTRPTFARCIECGRDIHRRPPTDQVVVRAGTRPFDDTADCSLHRRRHDGTLWYAAPNGLLCAQVAEAPDGRRRCIALDGTPVFDVDDYDAAVGGSVVVTDPADADRPLATYVVEGVLLPAVSVRDDASAPVARLTGSDSLLHLRETGGSDVAVVERRRMQLPGCWVDDRWELRVARELPTLDRRALVAVLLLCRALFSLPPLHHP